jgi:5'-deoxynucleotidase YfbR-like HD superfamily hydrolase
MQIKDLTHTQQLVLDICAVERNHQIPGSERHENVVEHSFSVALLCWKIIDTLKPNLDTERVFKYCIAHDFLERGLKNDVNTYADSEARAAKKAREQQVLVELADEFAHFPEKIAIIQAYEEMADEEARFVWTVDKMQAIT